MGPLQRMVVEMMVTLGLVGLGSTARAAEFHVAPDGRADGNGSKEKPWDLKTALAHPAAVKPGDVIWVRGGEYEGAFQARLVGAAEKPIVVRAVSGERVTIRGHLDIGYNFKAEHAWYWGFEIVGRGSNGGSSDGINLSHSESVNPGIRVINCVIHDNGVCGIGTWAGAVDNEIYGCLIYNNGYDEGTRGHGHGFYVQSKVGPKLIKDNIVFRNFNQGTQLYGSGRAYRDNVTHEGNTWFNNSEISKIGGRGQGLANTLWIEGGRVAENPKLISNYVYNAPWAKTINNHIGKSRNGVVKDNYFVAAAGDPANAFSVHGENEGLTMTGNAFYGKTSGFELNGFGEGNVRVTARPAESKVFVRPNQYEPGRANITIYNWPLAKAVEVDVSAAGLKPGDKFEVRDAQNFYGDPVVAGQYTGKAVTIRMTGLKVAALVGLPASYATPEHTAPEFGVFVIMKPAEPR